CQNQNIADSNAPIAMDLRREIFRMLEEGQNNDQIVDFLVDRYGDFVRYNPPVNAKTLVLWNGPVALLVLGFGVLASILVRRRLANGPGKDTHTLSEAERARLATLLDKEDSSSIYRSAPACCRWWPWLSSCFLCCAVVAHRLK